MKKSICLILILPLLLCLSGCRDSSANSVSFCYLRNEYTLGAADSVIASEEREISGRREDLDYLLGIYLQGPLDDTMRSPFPAGTRILGTNTEDNTLVLELSDEFSGLKGIDLTLAAGCLASTCFQLTDADAVRITVSDNISIVLNRDSVTLLDDSAEAVQPTGA